MPMPASSQNPERVSKDLRSSTATIRVSGMRARSDAGAPGRPVTVAPARAALASMAARRWWCGTVVLMRLLLAGGWSGGLRVGCLR